MTTIRDATLPLTLLPALVVALTGIIRAAPLPTTGPKGGHMIAGPLPGITSRAAAFKAGIHRLRGSFDSSPKLLGAVNSKNQNIMLVTFRAALHGAPVSGLVVTTYDPVGNSHSAVLYDTPQHFAQSLPPMLKRLKVDVQNDLEKQRPVGSGPNFAAYEAAAKRVPLTRTAFPDGTATIGIAKGFTPVSMSGARFGATAPDGAYANLYTPISLLDPNGSLYQQEMRMSGGRPPQIPGQTVIAYSEDPITAWKQVLDERANERGEESPNPQILSAKALPANGSGFIGKMVAGTMTLHGEPFVFSGLLLVSPPPQADGGWLLQITICGAPLAHAATDMPALIAMQRSEKVDMNAVRDQTMRNIAAINAECSRWLAANKAAGDAARDRVFETSMHNAQVSQDNIDRAAAGFIHYINGAAVVEHGPTGAHGTLDENLADALVKADPQNFHVVPTSGYKRGVDY